MGTICPPPQESSARPYDIVLHFPSQCVRKYGVCHIAETQILGHLRRGRDLCLDAVMKAEWHLSEPSVPELTSLSTTRPPILHPLLISYQISFQTKCLWGFVLSATVRGNAFSAKQNRLSTTARIFGDLFFKSAFSRSGKPHPSPKFQNPNPIQNHRQNISKTHGLRHFLVICRVGYMIAMFKPTFSHREAPF